MFQSDFLFLVVGLAAMLIVLAVCVEILVTGLLVEVSISILCLSLMMMSEATEMYSTAKKLVKAVERQTSFGQGDINVLALVKKTINRLSVYYVFLSALFVAFFFTMPYLFPALVFAFSQFMGLITSATISVPIISPLAAALVWGLTTVAVFQAGARAKAALFKFLPSDLFETDESMGPNWILHQRA
jgi:flagellar biosynthesis protein FliQ